MSKEQVLDKGIRQKSTKRVNSFIVCSAFCLGPPNRDPTDSEKRLRVYKSGATMACHVWRVDQPPGHTHRNRNACLKVLRLSMSEILMKASIDVIVLPIMNLSSCIVKSLSLVIGRLQNLCNDLFFFLLTCTQSMVAKRGLTNRAKVHTLCEKARKNPAIFDAIS